ncbi:hypothetical protein [Hymenobacter sp.]|uniref:hypothetical protein n=1 Tax=Hymenobacter sp. TaxID=1898978 RepID=UPI00286B6830|nr:hypothetical protein [Hymenobacter sp.]
MNAVFLFFLGGVVFAVAGILVGIALANWWGLAAAMGGLGAGLLTIMAGVFGITGHGSTAKSRFNPVTLAGVLILLGGLVLGWHIGGLLGVGVGLAVLGFGALVTGVGVVVGIPNEAPPPAIK